MPLLFKVLVDSKCKHFIFSTKNSKLTVKKAQDPYKSCSTNWPTSGFLELPIEPNTSYGVEAAWEGVSFINNNTLFYSFHWIVFGVDIYLLILLNESVRCKSHLFILYNRIHRGSRQEREKKL